MSCWTMGSALALLFAVSDLQAPQPKVIEVAAGLVFHQGRLLITQRRPGDHLGGLWEFPGGKREPQESFKHCLVRELREELGIEVKVGRQYDGLVHAYPEKVVDLRFLLCRLISGIPQPIAVAALAWISRDELDLYEFPAADAKLLDKLRHDAEIWKHPAC